jgi:2-polyprenyl-3-methyl-5-hydroxy-6-metoxy-1,4-benzoquinol methylase
MSYDSITQKIYTSRTRLYHLFIHFVGYARAVRIFFMRNHCLRNEMRILDAGCGSGLILKILYKIGKNQQLSLALYGFDLTPAMLELCKKWISKNNISSLSLQQADVLKIDQTLPADWTNFDLVTVSGMLEHLPKNKLGLALTNLTKRLRHTGSMIIFICRKNPLSYWLIYRWWKAQIYTKKELTDLFTSLDLQYTFKRFSFPHSYLNAWVHIIELKNE